MSLPPMLFMKLLADRKLNPGGIELDVGAGDMNALLPLIAEDSFSALASAFPCLVGEDLARRIPPELLQALLDTGCRMLPEEMTHVSSEQTKPVLPPAVHWLTGDWYLCLLYTSRCV